ncbi:hypothetical protein LMG33818_002004 [Halomonadaceae bacterium LMG 33818]|uniref:MgtC/SapB family protein n=1 Tax=Cernens ardua TaxID=3402176 RepID=UPI003EDC9310
METTQMGWGVQLIALTLAFFLSALIGLERELHHKSAGLRTCTVVGFSSALIMLVSKYGFNDMLFSDHIALDPSRVAAQIVSGIGFIGGGVIFMRRDAVQGLTTAASVWFTSAVGMACGAGLFSIALFVTVGHFVAMLLFPRLVRSLRKGKGQWFPLRVSITYRTEPGLLGKILTTCSNLNFIIERVNVDQPPDESRERLYSISLDMRGKSSLAQLTTKLSEIDGVVHIRSGDGEE